MTAAHRYSMRFCRTYADGGREGGHEDHRLRHAGDDAGRLVRKNHEEDGDGDEASARADESADCSGEKAENRHERKEKTVHGVTMAWMGRGWESSILLIAPYQKLTRRGGIMAVTIADGKERLDQIALELRAQLGAGKTPRARRTTVRKFLKWFGYARRGNYLTEQIRKCLEENQLRTVPDFEGAWIDGPLSFELDLRDEEGKSKEARLPDPTIRLDSIDAANAVPEILAPEANVRMALFTHANGWTSHM